MSFPGSLLLTEEMIRKETSAQKHPLGTRGYTRDGRIFHYAKAGATTLAIGKLNQTPTAHAHFTDGLALLLPADTLSTSIKLTLTGASLTTANALAEGYLMTKDLAGQGQMVVVDSHPVMGTAATTCVFNLSEDSTLTAAVTTGSTVFGMWHNVYQDVISTPAGIPTGIVVGVNTMAVTASYYFWIQTWGPCLVLMTAAAAVVGHKMQSSSGTAGAVVDETTAAGSLLSHARPAVGTCMEIGASGDHGLVYLTIAP